MDARVSGRSVPTAVNHVKCMWKVRRACSDAGFRRHPLLTAFTVTVVLIAGSALYAGNLWSESSAATEPFATVSPSTCSRRAGMDLFPPPESYQPKISQAEAELLGAQAYGPVTESQLLRLEPRRLDDRSDGGIIWEDWQLPRNPVWVVIMSDTPSFGGSPNT